MKQDAEREFRRAQIQWDAATGNAQALQKALDDLAREKIKVLKLVALDAAVLAEREACARLAERWVDDGVARGIARAIRDRGDKFPSDKQEEMRAGYKKSIDDSLRCVMPSVSLLAGTTDVQECKRVFLEYANERLNDFHFTELESICR